MGDDGLGRRGRWAMGTGEQGGQIGSGGSAELGGGG